MSRVIGCVICECDIEGMHHDPDCPNHPDNREPPSGAPPTGEAQPVAWRYVIVDSLTGRERRSCALRPPPESAYIKDVRPMFDAALSDQHGDQERDALKAQVKELEHAVLDWEQAFTGLKMATPADQHGDRKDLIQPEGVRELQREAQKWHPSRSARFLVRDLIHLCHDYLTLWDQHGARDPTLCQSGKDGDCTWEHCPQVRDKEPDRSGRHCPLDLWCDGCGESPWRCCCPRKDSNA
jgi:hypothetical protein